MSAPNQNNESDILDKMVECIRNLGDISILIGGNLNVNLNHLDRRNNQSPKTCTGYRQAVLYVIESLELIEIWKERHSTERRFCFHKMWASIQDVSSEREEMNSRVI